LTDVIIIWPKYKYLHRCPLGFCFVFDNLFSAVVQGLPLKLLGTVRAWLFTHS